MTSEEFTKNEEFRLRLGNLLADPVLQLAFAALQGEMSARTGGNTEINHTQAASKFHQLAGANHIINGLQRLTQVQTVTRTPKIRALLPETPIPTT